MLGPVQFWVRGHKHHRLEIDTGGLALLVGRSGFHLVDHVEDGLTVCILHRVALQDFINH